MNKLFALASVTALSGLVASASSSAGCSSSGAESAPELSDASASSDGDADGGWCCPPDPKPGCCMKYGGHSSRVSRAAQCGAVCYGMPWPWDPGWKLENDAHGCPTWVHPADAPDAQAVARAARCGLACPTTDAIDATQYPYKAANKQPGACSTAMVDALVAYVDGNKPAKYADAKDSVTDATCKACLFTVDSVNATMWGPFVEDAKGALIVVNKAGCVDAVSGKVECGKAYHQLAQCLDEACLDCREDDTLLGACYDAAAKLPCKAASAAVPSDCAAAIDTCASLKTKYPFEASARALCVGLGDAGDGG